MANTKLEHSVKDDKVHQVPLNEIYCTKDIPYLNGAKVKYFNNSIFPLTIPKLISTTVSNV